MTEEQQKELESDSLSEYDRDLQLSQQKRKSLIEEMKRVEE